MARGARTPNYKNNITYCMKIISLRGFSLIEVLVAMAILATGLLGVAGLIVKGQRATYEAYQRQQALYLAQDMAERIRSNALSAADYVTGTDNAAANMPGNGGVPVPGTNCKLVECTPAQLQIYDRYAWDQQLLGATEMTGGNKVGGIIKAKGCVESTDVPNRLVVSVAWQGDVATTAPSAEVCTDAAGNPWPTSDCGVGQYGDENRRRLVSLCIGMRQTAP
ncbi:hypothetical protein BAC2_01780 [uncultured bacterium]|nr:hypothetical protein BAC2_01780 [uncultured bacterium]